MPQIRRFVHPDGRWINMAAAEGQVVQFSGASGTTVPYFRNVEENTIAPAGERSVSEEQETLAADLVRQGYAEILPIEEAAGETKIDRLWRLFENWLYEQTPVFCHWPLAPGASEEEVQVLENKIGARLPDDIRQSYLRHNGSAGVNLLSVVGEGKWVTVGEATEHWQFFQDIRPDLEDAGYLETPKGPMKKVHISPGWIPISDNEGGDHLCVDLDPAEGGTVGQLFSYWHEYGAWRFVAPSFAAFLERLIRHLELGKYAFNDRGQLAPVNGPEPESVEDVQEYFQAE
jgi:cell wall assembly regulator SMI1